MFEAGKTYRTRSNYTAQILNDHGETNQQRWRVSVKGETRWAFTDGSFCGAGGVHDKMLPGAIEDMTFPPADGAPFTDEQYATFAKRSGPPTPRDVHCFSAVDGGGGDIPNAAPACESDVRLDKLEASINDVFRQLVNVRRSIIELTGKAEIEAVTGPIIADGDAAHFKILYARSDATKKYLMELEAGYMERFAEHQKVIAAVEEIARRSVDSFDVNNMVGVLNGSISNLRSDVVKNFQDTDNRLNAGAQAIDALQRQGEAFNLRLDALEEAVRPLGRYGKTAWELRDITTKMATANAGKTAAELTEADFVLFEAGRRIIRGGWVNIYRGDYGYASTAGMVFETKGEADYKAMPGRVACIRIPDITEGEGL